MKEVMKGYSIKEDGIPLFKYTEGCEDAGDQQYLGSIGPMADLKSRLLIDYGGQVRTVGSVIEDYNSRNLYYLDKNVKTALRELIRDKKIQALSVVQRRNSLPDSVRIQF